jgi:tight adherence protein B
MYGGGLDEATYHGRENDVYERNRHKSESLMPTIIGLVFVVVFALAALLIAATNDAAQERKLTAARLTSVGIGSNAPVQPLPNLRKQQLLSSIPLMNRFLLQVDIASRLRDLLSQANVAWSSSRLLLMCTAAAVIPGYLVFLRTDVFLLSLVAGTAFGTIPLVYVFFARRRRFDQFEEGLPGALDLMVSGLRSGHSLISALNLVAREMADPIGREFRICFDEQNYGLELRTAMDNLAKRVPLQDARIVITAILIQKETGGNLAEVLDKCGHVIRERFRLKKEIRIRTAQGRLTGLILSLLPLILGFLMYLVNPEHVSLLWKRELGLKMLYTASVMTVIGAIVIRNIVRIRV